MTTITHNVLDSQFGSALHSALAQLEKFAGPEVDALKAKIKETMDAAVAASGPIGAQIFNFGIESVPGLKIFAGPIEFIADPIVSNLSHAGAQKLDDDVTAALNQAEAAPLPQPVAG